MKFVANALFDEISGALGEKWVVNSVKNILEHQGQKVDGTIRRKVDAVINTFENDNLKAMFRLTARSWGSLSDEQQETWTEESKSLISSDYVVKSGYQLYMSYVMSLYVNTYGLKCVPESIAGLGEYGDRLDITITCQES